MSSLVESGEYGAINTTYTTTNGFYVIMFTSKSYTLQDNTTIDEQIIAAEELVVKSQCICSIQVDTNWYCNRHPQHHVPTVPTRIILHPQLEVNSIIDLHYIPKSVRHPICLSDYDYDYILEKLVVDKNDFEIYVEVNSDNEEN